MQTQAGKHQWKPSSYTLLFKRHLFSKDWFSIKLIISDNKCIFWIYYSSKNPKTKYITVSTNIWRNMISMEACFRHRLKNFFFSQFWHYMLQVGLFLTILSLYLTIQIFFLAIWTFPCNSNFISHISEFTSRNPVSFSFHLIIKNKKGNDNFLSHNSDLFSHITEFISHNFYFFFSELRETKSNCEMKKLQLPF